MPTHRIHDELSRTVRARTRDCTRRVLGRPHLRVAVKEQFFCLPAGFFSRRTPFFFGLCARAGVIPQA